MDPDQTLHLRSLNCWLEEFLDQIWFSCLSIPLVGVEEITASSFLSGSCFSIKSKHNPFFCLLALNYSWNENYVPFLSYIFAFLASRSSSVSRMWKSNNFYTSHLFPVILYTDQLTSDTKKASEGLSTILSSCQKTSLS